MKEFIKKLLGEENIEKFLNIRNKIIFTFTKRPKKEDNNIGIVKIDALGDAVVWLHAGEELYNYFTAKGKTVYLICNKAVESFYRDFSPFKNIISIDFAIKHSKEMKNIINSIRKVYFEKIINTHYSRSIYRDDFIIAYSCAKEKIGCIGNSTNRKNKKDIYKHCYTNLLATDNEVKFEGLRNSEIVRELGIDSVAQLPTLCKYVGKTEYKPFVAIGIGASDPRRVYSIQKYAKICDFILNNYNYEIRVVGGKIETQYYEKLYELCHNERLINMCGMTNLQELINVLGNAAYIISNDTGTAHIACAVNGVGTIILGGGNGNRFFPHIAESGETSSMQEISLKLPCEKCDWECDNSESWKCINDIDESIIIEDIKIKLINI